MAKTDLKLKFLNVNERYSMADDVGEVNASPTRLVKGAYSDPHDYIRSMMVAGEALSQWRQGNYDWFAPPTEEEFDQATPNPVTDLTLDATERMIKARELSRAAQSAVRKQQQELIERSEAEKKALAEKEIREKVAAEAAAKLPAKEPAKDTQTT